jgi:hypothetical protein
MAKGYTAKADELLPPCLSDDGGARATREPSRRGAALRREWGRVGLGQPRGSPQNCLWAFFCKNDENLKLFLLHIEINFKIGIYTRVN